jgi:hypothetical protein
VTCTTKERPVKHWPPDYECPVLTDLCEVPLPDPQCPRFTNRGGEEQCQSDACGCYCGEEWVECEEPPTGECFFPQGVPPDEYEKGATTYVLGNQVNAVMERLAGCSVGTRCQTGMEADEWFDAVNAELRAAGLCAGRHNETPPGATDEIAVATSCTGWWEGYHIYNYGQGLVVWSPGAARPSWKIDPRHCGDPTEPPPAGECPEPHPDTDRMKFKCREHHGILDCTWVTVGQPDYCASVGYCCMPGTPNDCDDPACVPPWRRSS